MAPDFRYAQTCPLARAAEVIGHRWNLLIVRELLIGPQRFSDLERRLAGVSASVLASRLADLEGHGVVVCDTLAPPAAARVYALSEHGRALSPAIASLTRWGLRWLLERSAEDDHSEPDWIALAVEVFGRRTPLPAHRYALVVRCAADCSSTVHFASGADGVRIERDGEAPEVEIALDFAQSLALISGMLPPEAALAHPEIEVRGDPSLVHRIPLCFDVDFDGLRTEPELARPPASFVTLASSSNKNRADI